MNHPGVSLILATGGSGMVKAAYSAGKPALGVGPGNVPCYIDKSANIERACNDLILSKTFDNGMICASEQAVVVDREQQARFEEIMAPTAVCSSTRSRPPKCRLMSSTRPSRRSTPKWSEMPAAWIAAQAGVTVPPEAKILIARLEDVGAEYPLSREKLSPVLAYYVVDGEKEGFSMCLKMLELGGLGHSAVIHSSDEKRIKAFGEAMKVGRVIANSPSSQGAIGDIYKHQIPLRSRSGAVLMDATPPPPTYPRSTWSTKKAGPPEDQHAVVQNSAQDLL